MQGCADSVVSCDVNSEGASLLQNACAALVCTSYARGPAIACKAHCMCNLISACVSTCASTSSLCAADRLHAITQRKSAPSAQSSDGGLCVRVLTRLRSLSSSVSGPDLPSLGLSSSPKSTYASSAHLATSHSSSAPHATSMQAPFRFRHHLHVSTACVAPDQVPSLPHVVCARIKSEK